MTPEQLEQIRARDAQYDDRCETTAGMMEDREILLSAYDALTQRCEFLERELGISKNEQRVAVAWGQQEKREREALKAERDSLTEQLGLARKDAERYRWLKTFSERQPARSYCPATWNVGAFISDAETLDAAVDEAAAVSSNPLTSATGEK